MESTNRDNRPHVAVVGGGLAGLAAALAAADRGMRVELFEQTKTLGGRAASFVDAESGQTVDLCQHVAMGCCTQFLDFCRRTDVADCFQQSPTLHFIGPEGQRCGFAPSRWLPAPLHLLPALMRLTYLSPGERWSIARAVRRLARENSRGPTARSPHPNPLPKGEGTVSSDPLPKGEGTIGQWLRQQGQSPRTIERFWSVVLVSALGETVDHASLAAAQKVFRDGFWASRGASTLILPLKPLGEIFHDRLGQCLDDCGVAVRLAAAVRQIDVRDDGGIVLSLADASQRAFDAAIVAVPWRTVRSVLSPSVLARMPSLAAVEQIQPAAITAIHLWFDRPITCLPHAVLVGRLGQWLFADAPDARAASPQHCQVVVSASHRLPPRKPEQWVADIRRELEAIWPEARQANLLRSRVIAQPAAVFSVTPQCETVRPPQQTPLANLRLAGDWTATGWPATMEGAVRSGLMAVESLEEART
jgi:squalene-associated FAD-dependent desaturase